MVNWLRGHENLSTRSIILDPVTFLDVFVVVTGWIVLEKWAFGRATEAWQPLASKATTSISIFLGVEKPPNLNTQTPCLDDHLASMPGTDTRVVPACGNAAQNIRPQRRSLPVFDLFHHLRRYSSLTIGTQPVGVIIVLTRSSSAAYN
jgi:hypothetical protein